MCEEAPVSRNHSVELGGMPVLELCSTANRVDVSQGVEDDALEARIDGC
jgi:hypothetical protein